MKINQKGFTILEALVIVLGVAIIAAVGWYVYQRQNKEGEPKQPAITNFEECKTAGYPVAESYPEQCHANGQLYVNETPNKGWNTTAKSARGAFEVTFPDGLGEVLKPLGHDAFYVSGPNQPTIAMGGKTSIRALEGLEGPAEGSPQLLSLEIIDAQESPRGFGSEFTLKNDGSSVTGKKYTYVYNRDEPESAGHIYRRLKGDRNYEYIFSIGDGKLFRVYYAVYAADPQDNAQLIEAIIDTVRLL
jgi:hypothetical protein